ncbi:MAG: HAMP domain-containing histidine kinase [Acidobacteriota bacterium]|nr:MAG: HAMP domain-containing histidine kinase [Acidobacteriota bacterium]
MPRSVYAKLAAILLVLLLVVSGAYLWLSLYAARSFNEEVTQKLNLDLAEHLVAEFSLIRQGRVDERSLEELFHQLMVINPSIEIYLLDGQGRILAYSAPPDKVVRESISLAPVRQFLSGPPRLPLFGDDPRDRARRKVFSAAPITHDDSLEGYLYVVLGGEQVDTAAEMLRGSYILQLVYGWIAVALVVALLVGLVSFRLLTRRLGRLSRAMEQFRRRDAESSDRAIERSRWHGGDEIDSLQASFENMARRIESQLRELQDADALRRELVANVSHDLRTPVAALRGALETLQLRDQRMSLEEKRRFVEIALRHSEHLAELVEELFELAKLDSGETKPQCEPVALAELVQDVLQKHELKAAEKRIQLTLDPAPRLPFVSADIRLIERVLDNLVANALRHTAPDGHVRVALVAEGDHVQVRISDDGSGIAAEDLPHVFERFFRGRDGKGGTGLGLAISKRIVELHGRAISATSRLGRGSTFSFDLPVTVGRLPA